MVAEDRSAPPFAAPIDRREGGATAATRHAPGQLSAPGSVGTSTDLPTFADPDALHSRAVPLGVSRPAARFNAATRHQHTSLSTSAHVVVDCFVVPARPSLVCGGVVFGRHFAGRIHLGVSLLTILVTTGLGDSFVNPFSSVQFSRESWSR